MDKLMEQEGKQKQETGNGKPASKELAKDAAKTKFESPVKLKELKDPKDDRGRRILG